MEGKEEVILEEAEDGMNVLLRKDFYNRVKKQADEENKTVDQLIGEHVSDYIKKHITDNKESKQELVGSIEYVQIEDGGNITIPDNMWENLNRNGYDTKLSDDGHVRIESIGRDTYKITRVQENQMPLRNIQVPENIFNQIQNHINDDAVIRHCKYSSIEDFVFNSIETNMDADRDSLEMNRR